MHLFIGPCGGFNCPLTEYISFFLRRAAEGFDIPLSPPSHIPGENWTIWKQIGFYPLPGSFAKGRPEL